jgi:DHA1 family inner membrane transport protein
MNERPAVPRRWGIAAARNGLFGVPGAPQDSAGHSLRLPAFIVDYLVITNLFLLLFAGVADNQMIAALLPALGDSFHVAVPVAGLLVVVYSVAAALASFISGALSDLYGRRWLLRAGMVLFALASWLASHTHSFPQLIAARALTGLGAGTISTCSIAFAGDWFPYAVRGRAIGLISSAYFAAPIVGVPLAGQIADRWGWQRVFFSFAVFGIAVALASVILPRDRVPVRNADSSSARMRTSLRTFTSFFAKRDLAAALGIAFLVSAGLVGFITYIGQWLSDRFQVATGGITLVFMVGGLASLVGAPLGGILSDRWGKRVVSIGSNLLMGASVAAVPFLRWGFWMFAFFGVIGLSAAFRQGPLTALMTEMVPADQRGSFIAVRNIASQLGIGVIALVGGLMYQRLGYAAVTTLCAVMTLLVALLLATHIAEPQPALPRSSQG